MKGIRSTGIYGNLKMRGKKTISMGFDWDDAENSTQKILKKEHMKEIETEIEHYKMTQKSSK